jgi:hypothetical protein
MKLNKTVLAVIYSSAGNTSCTSLGMLSFKWARRHRGKNAARDDHV